MISFLKQQPFNILLIHIIMDMGDIRIMKNNEITLWVDKKIVIVIFSCYCCQLAM
jgi:hypothetical protein